MENTKALDTGFYYCIEKPGMAEFKDRGSRFTAYSFPVATPEDCKQCLEEVRKEHPKASHHCFAYRLGLDMDRYRVSDDGEPSGSAGRPILGQIDSRQLTNTMIIVVRYFGGTLLGIPGLINAYKTSASLVLQVTPVVQKAVMVNYRIECDYTIINEVMIIIKQFGCLVLEQELQLFCQLRIGIPLNRREEVLFKLTDLRGISVHPL